MADEQVQGGADTQTVLAKRRMHRRALLAGGAVLGAGAAGGAYWYLDRGAALAPQAADPPAKLPDPSLALYPAQRNAAYVLDRDITPERLATSYNNFYEFGSSKNIWRAAEALPIRPWEIRIDGLVDRPRTVGIDDLLKVVALEERLYRFRCVEAWAMAVPWTGFAMKAFVDWAQPLSAAKFVRMESFLLPDVAPGQRANWYPWPYVEGLTIAEATHDLAFLATGIYGKPLPNQNGAPIRLVVPWKYGFKSIKSIVRFTFAEERPETFWETLAPDEYGFWANVNPMVHHPRWSQLREYVLGQDQDARVPTQIYNGYGDQVASLYQGMRGRAVFF
jgi:methionine sulfoxide reductase catalytic subunit